MPFEILDKQGNGLVLLKPSIFKDERGFFTESYKSSDFAGLGLPTEFPQDNHSGSVKGVIRGLHFQWDKPMGKLIRVTQGSAFVVEVDIRPGSPNFGKFYSFELNTENRHILWVPPGFANGFCSLSDWLEVQYKCTALWNPKGEASIRWDDEEIGIDWPLSNPLLSEKDRNGMSLTNWLEMPESSAFLYSKIINS